ncbi:sigma-54 interaction domain-containing protein [Jeotgalibacillus proteolyticus]|uniref:Sigma-54-dependent Fis family transcriptional regulator n=1 Tax=Jeotgalibacillus proteolyticus TaxID=2082395 RepID=A0A2S5GEI6_9BACL|nr:sigma 54-interacting transcriptional regulator [Jeotgalibacillus proteolyticus]PPA71358.1 sigma-54-dependent Fis family transcriptional regulator [Jeotgalibacillus proteolyticus]
MQKVLIVGAGRGGTALLRVMAESDAFQVYAVVDINPQAPGLALARSLSIKTGRIWQDYLSEETDIVIDVTGDQQTFIDLRNARSTHTVLVPGSVASLIYQLLTEKESLIDHMEHESFIRDLIVNSTHDGMIGIDVDHRIVLFNERASSMVGIPKEKALHQSIYQVVPLSGLPRIIETGRTENNQELVLDNGLKVVTTRIPMINDQGEVIGAFAVFKDITEVVNLAEEMTNLKEIQTMLEAIIQSSDDAISVVDEHGRGILINRAYTRLTGLTESEVINQPATADISEGESMHMQVLKTRRPVRGAKMLVGPKKREVVVNVAPIIVNGQLKGSVGVIHDMSEIQSLTSELDRARRIIRTLEAKYTFDDIIGKSDDIQLVVGQAKLAAKTATTVLIRGEAGTGKELFAHAIHNASDRKFYSFVRINCASMPAAYLKEALFGSEASRDNGEEKSIKKGLLEQAGEGTVFLDEIGELSLDTQAALLEALHSKQIIRQNGAKPVPLKARIIAATNHNLERGISKGQFLEELYYLLNKLPIQLPSLRTHKMDIPALCDRLVQNLNQAFGRHVKGVSANAIRQLMDYSWPGNILELENVLSRAMIFMQHHEKLIEPKHLIPLNANHTKPDQDEQKGTLAEQLERLEKEIIERTLVKHKGNKTAASKELDISIRNLYYKIEKYELETGRSV